MAEILSIALPLFLASFGIAITFGFVARKAKQSTVDGRLAYGPEIKALGWLLLSLGVGVLIAMFAVDHGGEYLAISGIAALCGLPGIWILMESYFTTGHFDDQQISLSSLFERAHIGEWAELQQAAFKKNGQYFELTFSDGTKIGLSKLLRGHRAVCEHVESLGLKVRDRPED